MRLSNRGWNNVLIFATLFMILLFNTTHQKFVAGDDDTERQPLVPASAIIQVIDYSGVKLERIGSNWRVQSALDDLPELNSEQLVDNWQSMQFEFIAAEPDLAANSYSLPVLIQAIGLDSQLLFMVHIEPDSELVYFHNKVTQKWQIGVLSELVQLMPEPLFTRSQ